MTEAQARQAAKSGEGAGMSAPLVLIPLGAEFLALTPAELAQARERALAILGGGWAGDRAAAAAAQSPEELLRPSRWRRPPRSRGGGFWNLPDAARSRS